MKVIKNAISSINFEQPSKVTDRYYKVGGDFCRQPATFDNPEHGKHPVHCYTQGLKNGPIKRLSQCFQQCLSCLFSIYYFKEETI